MASNTSYDWTACERIIWRETVSENGTVAMIDSNREMNVVRMFIAAACWGEACVAWRDKMAARETSYLLPVGFFDPVLLHFFFQLFDSLRKHPTFRNPVNAFPDTTF